jgi:DNA invertase Pin-like site-specific DNA recombinase
MPLNPSPFPPSSQVDCYLRDSGGDDQELSTEQQEAVIRQWCSANGLFLINVWKDSARPGSSTIGRTAFNEMMAKFRTTGCSSKGVIIWKFSRFSRDVDDSQFYRSDLRRRGFIVHSLMDTIPEGINGRFFEAAVDWMNQRYLEDLSVDVKRGLAHLVSEYGGVPGTPPRGFKRESINLGQHRDGTPHLASRWVPDPDLWDICHKAWEMRAQGSSYIQISAACPGLYSTKASWEHFFANRLYIGELNYGSLTIPNYAPPLVDQATWETVQSLNIANLRTAKTNPKTPSLHPRQAGSRYILSGIIRCARCGSPLSGNKIKSKKRPNPNYYYACTNKYRTGQCDLPLIPQEAIEKLVIENFTNQILKPDFLSFIQKTALANDAGAQEREKQLRTEINRQLATVRKRLKNITDAIADGAPPRTLAKSLTDYETQETQLLAQLNQSDQQITPIHEFSPEEIKKVAEFFILGVTAQDKNFQRLSLHTLIDHVSVDRTDTQLEGMITFYSPLFCYMYGRSHRWATDHTHNLASFVPLPFKRKKVTAKTPSPPTSSPPAIGDRPPLPDPQSPPPPSPAADPQHP